MFQTCRRGKLDTLAQVHRRSWLPGVRRDMHEAKEKCDVSITLVSYKY